ncbi:MAG: viperin family antiviral radical SAM protein [Candidatus Hodarchaeales archaeon]|jgi:radical S-adenosyl methionine domain-containing protein 2
MYSINQSVSEPNQKNNTIVPPICVNWHFWPYCNFSCSYCFARTLQKISPIPQKVATTIPSLLARHGTQKLTLTGGEPTLCSYLPNLIESAKTADLTTMLVSNGSRLSESIFEDSLNSLDWLGLSLDSSNELINQELGRGKGDLISKIIHAADKAREIGVKIKINTVVSALTWNTDFSSILEIVKPDRWKVFQVLCVEGENETQFQELHVTSDQYHSFVNRHTKYNPIIEEMEAMRGSYIMLDPQCRFFQNTTGRLEFSKSICDIGVTSAINGVGWDYNKFLARGGVYDW